MTLTGLIDFLREANDEDKATYLMVLIYEDLRKKTTGLKVYFAIPRGIDPRTYKHWHHFENARKWCDLNEICPEAYLTAQFIKMATWKDCPIPFPNQLATEGAQDRYAACVVKWNKLGKKFNNYTATSEDNVEFYDKKVNAYMNRINSGQGVRCDGKEYIAMMTHVGVFPEWFANRRVPDWKERAAFL